MKHRNKLRTTHIRKWNTYLDNCAKKVASPALKIMITSNKINSAQARTQNGHLVQKGT